MVFQEMTDKRTSGHIRDIHSRGTTFGINIQDEIKGLEVNSPNLRGSKTVFFSERLPFLGQLHQ